MMADGRLSFVLLAQAKYPNMQVNSHFLSAPSFLQTPAWKRLDTTITSKLFFNVYQLHEEDSSNDFRLGVVLVLKIWLYPHNFLSILHPRKINIPIFVWLLGIGVKR